MLADELQDGLTLHGAHTLTVCNACRYCEHYCPVFPALEQRLVFHKADLAYLSNLCHNCGECLYACQYAPPHEFGIDVPRTLARIRHRSYEEYAWPRWLGAAFRHHGIFTALLLAVALTAALFASILATKPGARWQSGDGNFYGVVSHTVMVALFGTVGFAVVAALAMGSIRCWRDMNGEPMPIARGALDRGYQGQSPGLVRALRDALTLRQLHATGADCVSGEERRGPWRRWFHHCTFYGFILCFASTSVAAIYHASGFAAPYAYTSIPVVLGTIGGLGLLIGSAGLWILRRRRDPVLMDPERRGLDESFLVLLFATSLTGLLLMVFRRHPVMGVLLILHLGTVLALFLTLPYGKFVHGLYRAVALLKFWKESESPTH